MGMDPRAMAAAMKRMGIDVRDIEGVEEVTIRTLDREYRFRKAQVSVMKAQGQETWTVVGKPDVSERAGSAPAAKPQPAEAPSPAYAPTPEDIQTVMQAASASEAAARKALLETDGDLAQAILNLS
ncbi:MAG: nascent polypeptide-associated complex protein [bacterium]